VSSIAERKADLRRAHRSVRATRSADDLAAVGRALAGHADLLGRRCVAAFLGARAEPPTLPLVEALAARGVRVLLPVLREDLDLEWAAFDGSERLQRRRLGLLEPAGPSLGLCAIAAADLVLVPALAVGETGARLGQGGGSYDRALRRAAAPVLAVVFDDEVLGDVPVEPHDHRVDGVVTPAGGRRALRAIA
jgi:5-formyltetrahydrofolate cyclo-ligase